MVGARRSVKGCDFVGRTSRGLLLAEALHTLGGSHVGRDGCDTECVGLVSRVPWRVVVVRFGSDL